MTDACSLSLLRPVRLTHLSALLASGPDARTFLQGQLSAELEELTPARALLASCSSAQGRVQAVLWLLERADGIALVTPAAVAETIAARLRKYILRSKVRIETDRLSVGVVDAALFEATPSLSGDRSHVRQDDMSLLHLAGHRELLVVANRASWRDAGPAADIAWRRADVAAGLPQIYGETYESFVAQMLNLDLLGAVSFTKGCYTGQEIIARTHYRGAVKRRMFRFAAACPPPPPGARVVSDAQHAGDVVDAVATDAGCELLAVVSLSHREHRLELESIKGIALEPLPLPYEIETD